MQFSEIKKNKSLYMNSKQIAIKYFAPKLEDPVMIFKDLDIFKSVLFWGRESAREFFATQRSKMFLVNYIDDVGPIVDEYLINRALKMYKNALTKRNKLFLSLGSSENVIEWLISRYINIFISLVSNNKYKNYLNVNKIKLNFNDDIGSYNSNIDEIIEFEKLKKFPKKHIKKSLKKVWDEAKYDQYFDYEHFNYEEFSELCCRFGYTPNDVVGSHAFEEPKFSRYQVEIGQFQLKLLF